MIADNVQLFLFPAIFGGIGLMMAAGALAFAYLSTLEAIPQADPSEDISVSSA